MMMRWTGLLENRSTFHAARIALTKDKLWACATMTKVFPGTRDPVERDTSKGAGPTLG